MTACFWSQIIRIEDISCSVKTGVNLVACWVPWILDKPRFLVSIPQILIRFKNRAVMDEDDLLMLALSGNRRRWAQAQAHQSVWVRFPRALVASGHLSPLTGWYGAGRNPAPASCLNRTATGGRGPQGVIAAYQAQCGIIGDGGNARRQGMANAMCCVTPVSRSRVASAVVRGRMPCLVHRLVYDSIRLSR